MQLSLIPLSPLLTSPPLTVADLSLNESSSDPPPAYEDSVAASPKPPPQKATRLFEVGMRLEAVDRKFPYFVCAAHIEEVKPQEGKTAFV